MTAALPAGAAESAAKFPSKPIRIMGQGAGSTAYDPIKDFAPITRVTNGVTVLVVHPSISVSNAQELIAYAKQQGNLDSTTAD